MTPLAMLPLCIDFGVTYVQGTWRRKFTGQATISAQGHGPHVFNLRKQANTKACSHASMDSA